MVLQAGLAHAACISVDDTGARHQGRNVVTTQIGSGAFPWFAITKSKTRLNFLELLSAGHDDYMINDAALNYMGRRKLAGSVITLLAGHETTVLAGPVTIATEGAL